MQNLHYSPLRYPGGKVSIYDFLKNVLKQNDIVDGIYAEPFAGGAGAALKLLMHEDVNKILLNDKDVFVYKFWHSVLYHTDDLLKLIYDTNLTIKEWRRQKEILKNYNIQKDLSDPEIAFTTFFLNRCNRSGILKAGVIGGLAQNGPWKIDARYNKGELMKRIEKISYYKERIKLYNYDAITFLKKMDLANNEAKKIMVYLDPPYVLQGKELYNHYYKEIDHIKLAKYLQLELRSKWVTSYDDHQFIHSIYKEVTKNIFEFNYFANRTKVGRELIITSKNCLLPEEYTHYSKRMRTDSGFLLKEVV